MSLRVKVIVMVQALLFLDPEIVCDSVARKSSPGMKPSG